MSVWESFIRQGHPCLFRLLTGYYCPGCGGTRAVWHLLHGRILTSIRCHPLVFYIVLMTAVEAAGYLIAKRTGNERFHLKRYGAVIAVGAALVMVNWVLKNYMLAVCGIDLMPGW